MKFYLKLLMSICSFFIASFLNAQQTIAIPDLAFEEALIDLNYDTNGLNGNILVSDAERITNLNLYSPTINKLLPNVHLKIKSLRGIERFTNLTRLDCQDNEISMLDVSKNINLTFLNCTQNKIKSLDVSNNPYLTFIGCDINQLVSLNLGNKPKLIELYCNTNKLTKLNLKECSALNIMDASENNISDILVSSTTISSIPEGWSKDKNSKYVASFREEKPSLVLVNNVEEVKDIPEQQPIAKKVYDEKYKQMIVKEFEKSILSDDYIQKKKEEFANKYNLDANEVTQWIDNYSKLMKLKTQK